MNRVEFTYNICSLIKEMFVEDEHPIADYLKRSTEEQKRLYDAKLTKCDGVKNPSKHQTGRAMDIYFLNDAGTELVDPKKGYEYWHQRWKTAYGGGEMIDWDKGHFEG